MSTESIPIWESTVDQGTYNAKVVDGESGMGVITVTRIEDDKEILREEVGLSFGAQFGPDVDDVRMWQVMVIDAIDHFVAQEQVADGHVSGV